MTDKNINVSGGLRTGPEKLEGALNKKCFDANSASWEDKMDTFPKYARRQVLTRFLAHYEIYKKITNVKGSIIECGVNNGFGIMTWAKLSAILEPVNLTRRIYGFDSFEGFPSLSKEDITNKSNHVKIGDLSSNSYDELLELINIYDSTRFLGHVNKVHLIKGDATLTMSSFVKENPHLVVSLLFLDFDLYQPTKEALKIFLPRMPKGAIVAFDELDNPLWPGETSAMLEAHAARPLRIERLEWDPYIGFAVLD